jgi:hypothetical protein
MTVRQLLTSLDSAELTEWMAFFKLERERQEVPEPPAEQDVEASLMKVFGKPNG